MQTVHSVSGSYNGTLLQPRQTAVVGPPPSQSCRCQAVSKHWHCFQLVVNAIVAVSQVLPLLLPMLLLQPTRHQQQRLACPLLPVELSPLAALTANAAGRRGPGALRVRASRSSLATARVCAKVSVLPLPLPNAQKGKDCAMLQLLV